MIELEFTVPPQIMVGKGTFGDGWPVTVTVSASPSIFPDHDKFVSISLSQGKAILDSETRVPRTEPAIDAWLAVHGRSVGTVLDRDYARRQKYMK